MHMKRLWDAAPRLRHGFCALLSAVVVVLGSRSTVSSISTLALAPGTVCGMASAKTSEAGPVDRKPKPTRQMERTSIACIDQLKWAALDKSAVFPTSATEYPDSSAVRASSEGISGRTIAQVTRPSYLRACAVASQRAIPPPASPAV